MRRILKNAPAKSAIIFFSQLLRFFLTFRSAYATICSVANRIIICSNISALPKMLAKASMRNTNFKKYAGLFRRPPNVANRIRLRRATSNAPVFNKISYAGLSKWSQRGGLENRLPNRHGGSNPSACANKNGLLLVGRPIFIATVRGDELPFALRNGEFAYRLWRYLAYCVGIPPD